MLFFLFLAVCLLLCDLYQGKFLQELSKLPLPYLFIEWMITTEYAQVYKLRRVIPIHYLFAQMKRDITLEQTRMAVLVTRLFGSEHSLVK